jgi:hypothetical protein
VQNFLPINLPLKGAEIILPPFTGDILSPVQDSALLLSVLISGTE